MIVRKKEGREIIVEIAESIQHRGFTLNERYLQHYFSHRLQETSPLLALLGNENELLLHPEWPTYKKTTRIAYGRYKKKEKHFQLNPNGTAGFIDFAVGKYKKPEIGIEFSLKYGWSHEEIVYDFLKLLDKDNPFTTSISLNILFREHGLVRGGYLKHLKDHMNNAYKEAVRRLNNNVCHHSREIYFMVTEIDHNNARQSWHYDKTRNQFETGLPSTVE